MLGFSPLASAPLGDDGAVVFDGYGLQPIVTGQPTVGSSAVAQKHDLTANGLTTGSPVITSSTLAQSHDLGPTAITTGQTVVGSPAVTLTAAITADGITAGQPTVGASSVAQDHDLTLIGITTGAPTVPGITMSEDKTFNADPITAGIPTLGTASLAQSHDIVPNDITTNRPVVGASSVTQTHILTATNITTAPPAVGSAGILHILLAAANVSISASVTADALRVRFAQSEIAGVLTTSASPVAFYVTSPQIVCAATVAANVNRVQFTGASTSIHAIFTASARLKWEIEPETPEIWTDVSVAQSDWAVQAKADKNWSSAT